MMREGGDTTAAACTRPLWGPEGPTQSDTRKRRGGPRVLTGGGRTRDADER